MDFSSILLFLITILSAVAVALTVGMVIWTFRDMRTRSRDRAGAVAAAGLVGVLNLSGLLIYLLLRPKETLSEAYERSLEEESLLQGIEEKPVCPVCAMNVKENWQICPSCHTRLKKPCVQCGTLLDLGWTLCPVCTTAQPDVEVDPERVSRRRVQRAE